jgi:MarR family transcriptional regulator, transcriptional regulator for hemolysin
LSQKELVREARIEQPSMAGMLARMERDGLIVRTSDPSDRRRALIALTPTAIERLPGARDVHDRTDAEALAGFTKEITTLTALLERVNANLESIRLD